MLEGSENGREGGMKAKVVANLKRTSSINVVVGRVDAQQDIAMCSFTSTKAAMMVIGPLRTKENCSACVQYAPLFPAQKNNPRAIGKKKNQALGPHIRLRSDIKWNPWSSHPVKPLESMTGQKST